MYKDCHHESCESSCGSRVRRGQYECQRREIESSAVCFPGCFCPDGFIRDKANKCIPEASCLDCVCKINRNSVKRFNRPAEEEVDLPPTSSNCTLVAAKYIDVFGDNPDFEVRYRLDCRERNCIISQIDILTQGHVINVVWNAIESSHGILFDGIAESLSHRNDVFRSEVLPSGKITLNVIDVNMRVSYHPATGTLAIEKNSQTYKLNADGICGNCGDEDEKVSEDDFIAAYAVDAAQCVPDGVTIPEILPETVVCKDTDEDNKCDRLNHQVFERVRSITCYIYFITKTALQLLSCTKNEKIGMSVCTNATQCKISTVKSVFNESLFNVKSQFKESKCADGGHSLN